MSKKHLEFYKANIILEVMPHLGLCGAVKYGHIEKDLFELFHPTKSDYEELIAENQMKTSESYDPGLGYWASGLPNGNENRPHLFTDLRQTIVLFMAAIAGELD